MNKYYLAFSKCEPIELNHKPTEKMIDAYIKQYGLMYIGFYETYSQAKFAILLTDTLFDNIDRVEVELHLEKCLQLEYKEV